MSLHQTARLEVCEECGFHGHIIFADGSKSCELASVEEVRDEAIDALQERKISAEEFGSLLTTARNSTLFAHVGDFEALHDALDTLTVYPCDHPSRSAHLN